MTGRVPIFTLLLIAANLVAAAFLLGIPAEATAWGFIPEPFVAQTLLERVYRALTSMFVHISPVHLLANLVLLAAVGPPVEQAAGPWRFLLVYFVGGFLGVGAHWAMVTAAQPLAADLPLVGASAPLAALIGYAWLRFYRARVPLFPKVGVPVWAVVAFWVALQVVGGLMANRQYGAPVAYWAHLGG
ncbi:MAG: rhomboid family intramembrane serine protease, partial [Armatimonadetes bacterium]|nr:rhomboid family intramembrane serine protease [Armatimonadota bacterium]